MRFSSGGNRASWVNRPPAARYRRAGGRSGAFLAVLGLRKRRDDFGRALRSGSGMPRGGLDASCDDLRLSRAR